MATVFFMKFNRDQGALIADEMTWHLSFKYGYRPSRYGDSILNLLDEDFSSKNNFAAVYAGVGFPSFHFEIARRTSEAIARESDYACDLDKTSELVHKIVQEVHGRMIDDKLRFLFGFDRDEMNRGKFDFEGKSYEIKQESIIKEARQILKFQIKADAYKRIFVNEGVIMGYDKQNGIKAYHVNNEGRNLDFAYPFDAIGVAKEIGTKIFADVNARMHLEQRRKGFSLLDGLFLLLVCYVEAYLFNTKIGGYTQIFMIDGKREFFKNLTCEINDHRSHLATEVIRAYRWNYINRDTAISMINRLLINGENWEPIETELFEASSDPDTLRKYLMGYRPLEVPTRILA